MGKIDEILQVIGIAVNVANLLVNTNRVKKCIELCKECLICLNCYGKRKRISQEIYTAIYSQMVKGYLLINDCTSAIKFLKKLRVLLRELGERVFEGNAAISMALLHELQYKYKEAQALYKEALIIMRETGQRQGLGICYVKLGTVCVSLSDYAKAKEYLEKALAIIKEIGDLNLEAAAYGSLGIVFKSRGDYSKAKEYFEKALAITLKIGDLTGEAEAYGNLGVMFRHLGDYGKAKEYLEKALAIQKGTSNLNGEANIYVNLGTVFKSLGDYAKAKEYLEKALAMKKGTTNLNSEAKAYVNLGTVFTSLGDYSKAKECIEKALAINLEIGDPDVEAVAYVNLGNLFKSLGDYAKAKKYLEKSLSIREKVGDLHGEAAAYVNLTTVLQSLGDYGKAKEYLEKAVVIILENGDLNGVAVAYINLGAVFTSLGEYAKAKEYFEKALAIKTKIGDLNGEAEAYGNLASLFQRLGDYAEAKEYYEKSIAISKETEATDIELRCHTNLSLIMLLEGNIQEAESHLFTGIKIFEDMRSSLKDNDQFKILFFDVHVNSYQLLSRLFRTIENLEKALYALELGRARALADLMSSQYSVEEQISVKTQTFVGIEKLMKSERNCICLYISYHEQMVSLWILNANKPTRLREMDVNDCLLNNASIRTVHEVFSSEDFRKLHVVVQEQCEDRSWLPLNVNYPTPKSFQEDSLAALRLVEEEEDENQQPDPTLNDGYNMIIAPVVDLLDEPEIIIVPDRSLFKVPFAALQDGSDKYLSESFRIRIVPSLTTLNLIRDSPPDYHSQTGTLIVGDPAVGDVLYKGRPNKISRLPFAKEEAEMVGRLLRGQPLLGKQATKQAVLQSINLASLIHFAAHGNAERGEIVLAPPPFINRTPLEEDYLLTMADISQVQLRAKLVVLSCCHSARGEIRSEGVVGIARAFLGSGARSVLVALWAIEDGATKQFMSRFYEHLVRGESASESLYQTMKWMRANGYSKVGQWAPFMLIGDNVTFHFGK